jgi:hypothetical protein
MKISQAQAKDLCKGVCWWLKSWPAIRAALQCGAIEDKARGQLSDAISAWLAAKRHDLLVLPEYRPPLKKKRKHIDFALVEETSVGSPTLTIDTIFEVKFNYASQIPDSYKVVGELSRVKAAITQAKVYKKSVKANGAYLIYLVADCCLTSEQAITRRTTPNDNGRKYYRKENGRSLGRDANNAESRTGRVARKTNVLANCETC